MGEPFLFWEEGGFVGRRGFYWNAFWGDLGFALGASFASGIAFRERERISKGLWNGITYLKGEARE